MKKILVVGSLNMDIVSNMKRIPNLGETVLGEALWNNPGGKGANQCYTVGKLGGNAAMLGCVGFDSYGDKLIQSLISVGIDADHIKKCENAPTGTALIHIDQHANNSIVVIKGANEKCDIPYLKDNDYLIQDCDIILIQMEISYDAVYYVIQRGWELGKKIILNPAPAPEGYPKDILSKVDIITPNETELEILTSQKISSQEDIIKGAKKLIKQGTRQVIVTIGSKGAMYVDEEGHKYYPTRKVVPVDTTGAGDCFNGALAVGLSEALSIDEAIKFANIAASISVTKKGAQSSVPSRKDVDEIKNSLNERR